MAAFEYRQAEEVRDALRQRGVRYLFIGKPGAILLGYPDTTQDADLFVERDPANGTALVSALRELGFALTDIQAAEIVRGKIRGRIRAAHRRRRLPRLPHRRHHREQGSRQPGKGPGIAREIAGIQRILEEAPFSFGLIDIMKQVITAGIKELKNRLSEYLRERESRRGRSGQREGALTPPRARKGKCPKSPVSLPDGTARQILTSNRGE